MPARCAWAAPRFDRICSLDRRAYFTALAVLATVAVTLLALNLAYFLLLAFAGVLLAVLLRNLAAVLAAYTPLPVGGALAVVVLTIAALIVLLFTVAGARMTAELMELAVRVPDAWGQVEDYLSGSAWGEYLLKGVPSGANQSRWSITGVIGPTVSAAAGAAVNLGVVLAVGIFLAADPALYRRGFLHLVPKRARTRAREVLDVVGKGMWWWIIGQSIDMVAVALMTGLGLWLIGVPTPVTLGLIAGVTNFIPFVGPFIGGVPAVLMALSQSTSDALYTALLFLVVQQVEGHVLMPMIQKRTTFLPPALTILAILAAGSAFGFVGMLLATPLLVVGLIFVQMLYVEEILEDHDVEEVVR